MKITEAWIKQKTGCTDRIEWFLSQKETESIPLIKKLIKNNKSHWAYWLICNLMDKPTCVRYAIFAAQEVLPIFEKKHPRENRPKKAIEAAERWLTHHSKISDIDATYWIADTVGSYCAAHVRTYSADASYCAAYAAAYAAYTAAYPISDAPDAATATVEAANEATKGKLHKKIIEYGIKLLNEHK